MCKQLLALIGRNNIKAPMKKEHLHKVLETMYNFCKKIESDEDSSETLECIVSCKSCVVRSDVTAYCK